MHTRYGFWRLGTFAVVALLLSTNVSWADSWVAASSNGSAVLEEASAAIVPELLVTDFGTAGLRVDVNISGLTVTPRITKAGTFVELGWTDQPHLGQIGTPAVPVIRRLFTVPVGAEVSCDVAADNAVLIDAGVLGGPFQVMPIQAPIPKLPGAREQAEFCFDAAAYGIDADLPGARVAIEELGITRGQRLLLLEVRPMDYNPVAQRVLLWTNVTVDLRFAGGDRSGLEVSPLSGLDKVVLNPQPRARAGRGGNYLIVVADVYEAVIADFATAKQNQGFYVMTYAVPAGTSAAAIKSYIQGLWGTADAPDYILLVGDTDRIPHWTGGGSYNPVTDLPYTCMDGASDWFPDIAIGRFPVRSTSQLADVVEKTLLFEDGPLPDPSYNARAVFMASEDNYDVSEGTHNWCISTYLEPANVVSDKLYCHTYNATTQQVRDAFNGGRLFGVYSGHGGPSGWGDGPPFYQSDVRGLTNYGMYSFVLSFACSTGTYNDTECFTETWLLEEDKGATSVWGSSVSSYWDEDDIMQRRLFTVLYDDYVREVGPAFNLTRTRYAEYWGTGPTTQMYFEMYNLMGDPSLYLPDTEAGLSVSPSCSFASEGPKGGPFAPESKVYQLTNRADYAIDFEVTHDGAAWVTLSGDLSGTLPPSGTANVTVTINSNANLLNQGSYFDTVFFTNTTDHVGDALRAVELTVGVPTLQIGWDLDTNPGWTTTGQWAWGHPTGGGGEYGYPDPTGGHTGSNVYGYNLSGDYTNNMPEYNLTTAAIDCTGFTRVTLKFWRWLGVEQPTFDHAYVRVSNDGTNWTTVWENDAQITDNSWQQQSYDISAIANDQPTVYVRWTMGTTDTSWRFCGWNIDDVEIWAVAASLYEVGDLNCDGHIDGFDIEHFIQAIDDMAGYIADHDGDPYPPCDPWLADMNQDGHVDGFDIDGFVLLLGS
ncbi:MAG: hypothetical protein KKB50_19605 [Planctomycetes bacterium]|nr:hypothetical protein [Planctomycetota bacterium]